MEDDGASADGAAASAKQSRLARFFSSETDPDRANPELRERMRTLDPIERKWGFAASALPLLVAAFLVPYLVHDTVQTTTVAPVDHKCAPPYKLSGTQCVQHVTHHPSQYLVQFLLALVLGLVLLAVVWFARRTLTIFVSFLAGLAIGALGLALIGYGGWLLVRSWRLQRYGATDGKTVREVSMRRAEAKREYRRAKSAGGATPSSSGKAAPTPSKRYTPKSKPRRR